MSTRPPPCAARLEAVAARLDEEEDAFKEESARRAKEAAHARAMASADAQRQARTPARRS
jgi:hypothetical protein